jgi:hypothetical protein
MRFVDDDKIYVRQSWLNDALMCPERARLMEKNPELRRENDSAMMGTACHTAIEAILNNEIDAGDAGDYAVHAFRSAEQDLWAQNKQIYVTNTDPAKWDTHIHSMASAWVRDILPVVPLGGETEHKFAVHVGSVKNALYEYELYFEGTIDYVHPSGLWDWKTSARKYSEVEKQTQNIQSALYVEAMVRAGVLQYPSNFSFGVMIRNASSSGQVVSVKRTEGHGSWVVQQAQALINGILLSKIYLPDERWLINDQHFLCSDRWCPVWSMCKGAHIKGSSSVEEA